MKKFAVGYFLHWMTFVYCLATGHSGTSVEVWHKALFWMLDIRKPESNKYKCTMDQEL